MNRHLARIYSGELEGVGARIVEIEADVSVGLRSFNIVGLADRALNEAKERVNAALKNSGVRPPNRENRRVTINLAPADMRKTGSHYDLGIAIGYLIASGQLRGTSAPRTVFLGEVALDGRLRPVSGALNITERAARENFAQIILPKENANEAAAIEGIRVLAAETLEEVIAFLEGRKEIARAEHCKEARLPDGERFEISEIRGQENAKRALMIAAAARHNVLLIGPPGMGKSILAKAMAEIMPDLDPDASIEVTKIWSAAGLSGNTLITKPPFRAPHHTISQAALVGGGPDPRPGEISLAHRGVLFLDELPEFSRGTLEALREPLESGEVRIARARRRIVLPSRFTLIAAMNPCPCGYYGDPAKECRCSAYEVIKYQKKVSGPLLDRIDLQIKIGRVEIERWNGGGEKRGPRENITAQEIRRKVAVAKAVQSKRYSSRRGPGTHLNNADLTTKEIKEFAKLDAEAKSLLDTVSKQSLSPRAYYRLIKTARTIADLEGSGVIAADHVAEAFSYQLKEI